MGSDMFEGAMETGRVGESDENQVKCLIIDGESDDAFSQKNITLDAVRKRIEEQNRAFRKVKKAIESGENTEGLLSSLAYSQQIATQAYGEYVNKPYDQEYLAYLTALNQRLWSCIDAVSRNSVGVGIEIKPYLYPHQTLTDFDAQQKTTYREQSLSLIRWLNRIAGPEKRFADIAVEQALNLIGLGDCYLEVVETAKGDVAQVYDISPKRMWIGTNLDRYIQMKSGKKVYFKKFFDDIPRNKNNFERLEARTDVSNMATKVVHIRKPNLLSSVYGVPDFVPSIPQVVGSRKVDERNKVFFDNDAVPRLAITISGGGLSEDTETRITNFLKSNHKGAENAHRIMVLAANAANTNSPNFRPPKIEVVPLTVSETEDGSFLKYKASCEESIREAFRISKIFLGTSSDVNRAAAFTMREMTVELVFRVVGGMMADRYNETLLKKWMVEENISEEECLVEIGFAVPATLTQKDRAEITKAYASAGAYSPDDIREMQGLEPFNKPWSKIPLTLAIVFAQMTMIDIPDEEELLGDTETDEEPMGEKARLRQGLKLLSKVLKPFTEKHSDAGESAIVSALLGADNDASLEDISEGIRDELGL